MTSIRPISAAAVICWLGMAFSGSAQEGPAPDDLLVISRDHLRNAHICREAVGMSQFHDARVAVENVLRSTGTPAYVAISRVDDMLALVTADPVQAPPAFTECIARMTASRKALSAWKAEFHHLEDHHPDGDIP